VIKKSVEKLLLKNSLWVAATAAVVPWVVVGVFTPALGTLSLSTLFIAIAAGMLAALFFASIGRQVVSRRFRKLAQSEAQLLGLMRLSGDWYWEQDNEGRITSILHRSAPQAHAESGPSVFPVLGQTRWDLPGLEVVEGSWDEVRAVMQNQQSFEKRLFRYTSAQGERLYFESSGMPQSDWQGNVYGYCGVSVNVTEGCLNKNRRRAERALLKGLMLGLPEQRLFSEFVTELASALHCVGHITLWAQRAADPTQPGTGSFELLASTRAVNDVSDVTAIAWPQAQAELAAQWPGVWFELSGDDADGALQALIAVEPHNGSAPSAKDRARVHDALALLMLALERQRFEAEIQKFNDSLEVKISERTAALVETNKELESFSYTVSHDLRAPLRAIDGFTNIILEDYGDVVPADAQQLLKRISNNAAQMGNLIDGLLDFSRLLRNQPVRVDVSMQGIVEQSCEQLNAHGRATVTVGDLPATIGDPLWFTQVWMNLIDNALKFSGKKTEPCVSIKAKPMVGGVRYTVQDNGAGFDPAYKEKLFNVFERLHHKKDFDGTGVGLAIVKRIIERHGGHVFADSQPGEGACFGFYLPTQTLAEK